MNTINGYKMNLSKGLKDLLLSENEEDCILGFEIAKRKGIKATTLDKLENMYTFNVDQDIQNLYDASPMFNIIDIYLERKDLKIPRKFNSGYTRDWYYYKWREDV